MYETIAVISNDGSLFLKGELIASEEVLKNDIEEIPTVVSESLTSVFVDDLVPPPKYYDGPNDWILEPLPTPTPTSTPTGINQDPQKKEWMIKNADGDIIALLDLSSGDLTIKGEYRPWSESDSITGSKFVIRTSSDPNSKVFIIDHDGNAYSKGALFNKSL